MIVDRRELDAMLNQMRLRMVAVESVGTASGDAMQIGSVLLLVSVLLVIAFVPVGLYGLRQVLQERGFWRNF